MEIQAGRFVDMKQYSLTYTIEENPNISNEGRYGAHRRGRETSQHRGRRRADRSLVNKVNPTVDIPGPLTEPLQQDRGSGRSPAMENLGSNHLDAQQMLGIRKWI
ncbi:hypothetical protein HAX54_053203 [Datura stramonium]|uniref:Uncharacterized protein n=1 Tax=Datura stramonium TaxID=4076 RepID=A0ABS8T0X4_DATST|nr:hypothetical protein [Datura stramonium]